MSELSQQFIADSRAFLSQDYLPTIERCVAQLTEEQIWSRTNNASNSIGNLLLHLTGSSRYWAIEVIGGKPIGRVRQREFDQRDRISADQLRAELRAAVGDVDHRLAELSDRTLLETRASHEDQPTVLWCVLHIVEHFAMHTGQVLSMTKALVGEIAAATEST